MKTETLSQIIANKNAQRERNALDSAADIIEQISRCQSNIEKENKRIQELRAELKALEVVTIDAASILGE